MEMLCAVLRCCSSSIMWMRRRWPTCSRSHSTLTWRSTPPAVRRRCVPQSLPSPLCHPSQSPSVPLPPLQYPILCTTLPISSSVPLVSCSKKHVIPTGNSLWAVFSVVSSDSDTPLCLSGCLDEISYKLPWLTIVHYALLSLLQQLDQLLRHIVDIVDKHTDSEVSYIVFACMQYQSHIAYVTYVTCMQCQVGKSKVDFDWLKCSEKD